MTMFIGAAAAILVAMGLALTRALVGPSLYDRVLAGNSFGTKTILLLGLMGFITGRPDFLDIALLYSLMNFIATIAILKFFRYGTMGRGMRAGNRVRKKSIAKQAVHQQRGSENG